MEVPSAFSHSGAVLGSLEVTRLTYFSMCMNWKVVAGLAVIGLGVWAVAPNLIGAAAPLLLLAACPLSMVLMMRGMGAMGGNENTAQPAQPSQPTHVGETRDEQLAELKTRHAAIAREIAQMEAERTALREPEPVTGMRSGISPN